MKRNFQKSVSNFSSIEQEINAIFNCIESTLKEGFKAEKLHPAKGSTFCKGEIRVFMAEDLRRMNEDTSFKAKPVERYAFYADTLRPSRIGSVAIYGNNAFNRCLILNMRGFFFGRKIVRATVEQGLRPFVDVKLAV